MAVFLASLAGSPHCAGMCGGFVALYSANRSRSVWPHLAYNFGRVAAYMSLGSIAGYFGRTLDRAGEMAGVQHSAGILLCVVMLVWGTAMLGGLSLFSGHKTSGSFLSRLYQRLLRHAANLRPEAVALSLGLLSALLPCGWLYLFLAAAAGTSSPIYGAAVLLVFWLGTLPIMLALGRASAMLTAPMRRMLPRLSAVILIVAALFSLNRHVGIFGGASNAALSCHHLE